MEGSRVKRQPVQTVKINCMRCKHYYVTWEPEFPRGCRAFGFKTAMLPSAAVFQSSGQPCLSYEPK